MGETEAPVGGVAADWLLADVGNSHTKIRLMHNGRTEHVELPSERLGRNIAFFKGVPAAVASVNPARLEAALRTLGELGANPCLVLQSDGAMFRSGYVTTDVETPETTGVDRVLGCLGALLESPDRPVVVVDCGTATTVNVMTPDRCFRGGLIMPGRRLLAAALHRGTAALPEVDLDFPDDRFGKSTHAAIRAGASAMTYGGAAEGVRVALVQYPRAVIFLTGGDAHFIAGRFPEFRHLELLTLHGLYWYATKVSGLS